jgi:hypothetical protein
VTTLPLASPNVKTIQTHREVMMLFDCGTATLATTESGISVNASVLLYRGGVVLSKDLPPRKSLSRYSILSNAIGSKGLNRLR